MPQPPKQPPMTMAQQINIVYSIALIAANTVTPFLRTRQGTRAYGSTPFTFVLMLCFSEYCRILVLYIPLWVIRVLWMRLLPCREQHSLYGGIPLLTKFWLSEKSARTLEPFFVFFGCIFLGPIDPRIAECGAAAALAMLIVWGAELEARRAAWERYNDARKEMEFQARIARGEF